MLSRIWTYLVFAASLATLAGVLFYFVREYSEIERQKEALAHLEALAQSEGPCAALQAARELGRAMPGTLSRSMRSRRRAFAAEIVGEGDLQAQAALLTSDEEGLVDRTLCEQILLVRGLGESHPVLELLRFTREGGDPCQDPQGLSQALDALTSHRRAMLHALMAQVSELHCVPPWLATRLADAVLDELHTSPASMDDLDVLRVAHFLDTWSPVRSAQFSCLLETDGRVSRVAAAVGCTPYHKRYVIPLYRCNVGLPARDDASAVESGAEVLLLEQEGERCQVRPTSEPPRSETVACRDLSLLSDVHVAVLIEAVSFGMARASLVAGVLTYDGATDRLYPTSREPELKSWYGYDRSGVALGMTHTVRLDDLAAKYGEDVPDNPLRTFCRQSGARYCYDVDWAQVVGVLKGDPIVYLSRPMRIFLQAATLPEDVLDHQFSEAYGRPSTRDAVRRAYDLASGGTLLVEATRGGLNLCWRLRADSAWSCQAFGLPEGGSVAPTARLLAAMDIERDGRPELLIQRIERARSNGAPTDTTDTILMLGLEPTGPRFRTLNRLVVHEY